MAPFHLVFGLSITPLRNQYANCLSRNHSNKTQYKEQKLLRSSKYASRLFFDPLATSDLIFQSLIYIDYSRQPFFFPERFSGFFIILPTVPRKTQAWCLLEGCISGGPLFKMFGLLPNAPGPMRFLRLHSRPIATICTINFSIRSRFITLRIVSSYILSSVGFFVNHDTSIYYIVEYAILNQLRCQTSGLILGFKVYDHSF